MPLVDTDVYIFLWYVSVYYIVHSLLSMPTYSHTAIAEHIPGIGITAVTAYMAEAALVAASHDAHCDMPHARSTSIV